ncbi:MAG: DnaJ domain-containing protein [Bdellovibrionales bacterium]
MPRIDLKPNSAEFADPGQEASPFICDMPGCPLDGEHRAPKDRSLAEYYHFCTDHAREYNKAWNFFEGMSSEDVEEHIYNAMYGERPTWKYGVNGNAEDMLYQKAWTMYGGAGDAPNKEERERAKIGESKHSKEYEAMAIMGLEPPLSFEAIKTRYRALALQHHPDRNQGCAESEEKLKQINMAYTVLKLAYEKFEKLPVRS